MNIEKLYEETAKVVRKSGENPYPEVRLLKNSLKLNTAALDLMGQPEKLFIGFSTDNVYIAIDEKGNKIKDGTVSCGGIKNKKISELGEVFSLEATDNESIFKLVI